MKNFSWKKVLPHVIAIVVFLVVALVYCRPALEGKVLQQHDTQGWKGTAQQSFEFKEKYGHMPLWSNSMFGGMPAYTFAMDGTDVQTIYLQSILSLGLPVPISFFFLACLGFYFLCMVLRINPYVGILTSLAYAYSTYDPIIIAVGHNTKMLAIAYAPAVIGALLLIYQRKYLLGAALFALFFGLQTSTQHIQVLYYTCIVLGFLTLAYLYNSFKTKDLKHALPGLGVAFLSAIVGLFAYAVIWLPLQDYAKETMRGGKSELTAADSKNKSEGGLDKDYAFFYGSYGVGETFTLMVPGIYGGGGSGSQLKAGKSKFAEKLTEVGVPEENAVGYANSSAYWGNQPGHAGPVYLGAIICFLFILGLVFVNSWHKWWIIAATIVAILLSWGKNFSSFNYFIFDHLPFYNKFRAPAIALVVPQLTFALLAALGLQQLITSTATKAELWKKFKTAVIATGAIVVILIAFYFSASFSGPNDGGLKEQLSGMMLQSAQGNPSPEMRQQASSFGQSVIRGLQEDRKSLFSSDLIRCIILIGLAIVLIGAFLKDKITQKVMVIGLLVLSSYDLLSVASRYLNSSSFVEKDEFEAAFLPNAADNQILQDKQLPFRVFDESDPQGPFNGSRASYFHNSIGGYSPAKLALYNDIITRQLSKGNMEVFNMLNTRYFIRVNPSNNQPVAQRNPGAYGPCWFVQNIKFVNNADQEMAALDSGNLKTTAIVQKKYESIVKGQPVPDSSASIQWIENLNDKVTYKTNAATNQFAVFSEIYYDQGWNAYIDGQKTAYCKVNYLLRGMPVPAGSHTIEFRFEPAVVKLSNSLTIYSTLITVLLLVAAAFYEWKQEKRKS